MDEKLSNDDKVVSVFKFVSKFVRGPVTEPVGQYVKDELREGGNVNEELKVGRELDVVVAKMALYLNSVNYSGDTDELAWQVVDMLTHDERLDTFDLQWCSEDSPQVPNEHCWYAIFIPFEGEWCSGWGDTAAEAICRAAVEWSSLS